uniref:uncharacterized protein LOC122602338 n=1 Tax=Erigeron canadensis TaxID=72917 RepID=UPI001CB8B738|nr:uncharacterized protein LOC122602338 [Erigeron canadensis]
MKTRSKRKPSAADLLITPPSPSPIPIQSPNESPKIYKFSFAAPPNSGKKHAADLPTTKSPASMSKSLIRIPDLRNIASSHIDSLKRQIDCSYSDLLAEFDVPYSRLQKRYKAQNQACKESMAEAEKDFKKVIDHMSKTHGTLEVSYKELIGGAQARATHLSNTSIPELKQSVEKAIDTLRSHYGAVSTSS